MGWWSFFGGNGRRSYSLLVVLIVEIAGYVIERDGPLIVDAALHAFHRLLRLLLRLVLDKDVAWVCTDVLLVLLHKPMMHDLPELRKPFNEILLVLRPFVLAELSGHVGGDCVDHPYHGGVFVRSRLQSIHWEVGLLIFEDVDGSKGGCLRLSCSLSLRDYIIAVAAISQSDSMAHVPFEKLNLLQLANPACFLDWGELDGDVPVGLVDLKVDDWAAIHLILEIVLGHESGDQISEVVLSDPDLKGHVCDHKPSHLLSISERTCGHSGIIVQLGHPREWVPKLALVISLVPAVVVEWRSGPLSFASFSRNRGHGYLEGHGYFSGFDLLIPFFVLVSIVLVSVLAVSIGVASMIPAIPIFAIMLMSLMVFGAWPMYTMVPTCFFSFYPCVLCVCSSASSLI